MADAGSLDVHWPISLLPEETLSGCSKTVYFAAPELRCRRCAATGWVEQQHCPVCSGTGVESIPRHAEVTIAAGVQEGQRLRLAGGGLRSPEGKVGDAQLECRIAWHGRLRVEGDDLVVQVEVPPALLQDGGPATAYTPYGPQQFEVSAGSGEGQEVQWAGWGLTRPDGTRGTMRLALRAAGGYESAPDPEWVATQLRLAREAVRAGQWQEACRLAATCCEACPQDPQPYFLRGKCLFRLGCGAEAVDDLEQAATLAGDRARPWVDLARYGCQAGDYLRGGWAAETALRAGYHLEGV